ncbi:MAG TPA: hypothetical protein VFW07_01150 [Parafilimonas sp.]|nr:hypothetical protein [Parafilimonas sp.]
MEATFSIKASEFDEALFEYIKGLLKRKEDLIVTISIGEQSSKGFLRNETRKEYFDRLDKAIKNLNSGYGKSFSEEELDNFSKQLLNEP